MKTSLNHLSLVKQYEVDRIVKVLFEELGAVIDKKSSKNQRRAWILKIIPFGSFAYAGRVGDYNSGYKGDYDILVSVDDRKYIF